VSARALSTTDRLVALCQTGERVAQAEFYGKYRHEVARTVQKILGPNAELEDVVQDVFIEVFRSIDRYKGSAKITTWLYRVCVNVALQKIRRQKRRPEGHATEESDVPTHETPLSALERKEAARLVYGLLDTLPVKKRMVFILHEILGLDPKEIAEIVDTNGLTVRTRLHYARKEFFSQALKTQLFEGELS
jgi:RNA polymerase sigma-70 factor, ECF subfamily